MSSSWRLQVFLDLRSHGRVGLDIDIRDLTKLSTADRSFILALLDDTAIYATEWAVEAIGPDREPEPEPEPTGFEVFDPGDRPRCSECDRSCETAGGLAVHMARAHGMKSGGGKRCAEEGCETVLSVYNKAKWCAVHERAHPPAHFPVRGGRSA